MRNKRLIILFCVLLGVTLIILLGSVIFAVRNVDVHCYNALEPASKQQVINNHGIKKNKNIFMLNKQDVIDSIESNVPNVKVITVEKKFPNKIIIDYIEITEYIKVFSEDKTYYASNEGKILRIKDGTDLSNDAIIVKLKGNMTSRQVGENITSDNSTDMEIISGIINSLGRLGYRETVVDIISEIDITNPVHIFVSTSTGLKWQLYGGDYLFNKLHHALSVYLSDKLSDEQKKTGILKVWGTDKVSSQYDA